MKKAIVVDDSRVAVLAIKRMLNKANVEVIGTAADIDEFEALLEKDGVPDFVTMDMVLPKGDGVQACKRLWQKWDSMPVIMITAKEMTESEKKQLPHVQKYVLKPITQDKINNAIASISFPAVPYKTTNF